MHVRAFITMTFTCFLLSANSQTSLIGKWRRIDFTIKNQEIDNKKLKWGDLDLRLDSTFHMPADSLASNSTISGWNIGAEMNGTWELRNGKRLILWLEPKEYKMFLSFDIVKLTNKKLVLRSTLSRHRNKENMRYMRL